jgi:hypothetical protein
MAQVTPVMAGHRITLTYTLHRRLEPGAPAEPLVARAKLMHSALLAALEDAAFMPQGGHIGFHCRHLYEETVLKQVSTAGLYCPQHPILSAAHCCGRF